MFNDFSDDLCMALSISHKIENLESSRLSTHHPIELDRCEGNFGLDINHLSHRRWDSFIFWLRRNRSGGRCRERGCKSSGHGWGGHSV